VYSFALLALAWLLPPLIVALGNDHRVAWVTVLRFSFAVVVGWLLFYGYALSHAWEPASGSLPSEGDGAKTVFAAFFGWVIPALCGGLSCWLHRFFIRRNVRAAT
jgi:hypothetical protein